MKRLLLLSMVIFNDHLLSAQENPFMIDANGKPLFWGSQYVADGSPYFHDEYNWAEITTVNGKVYKDIRVKFNVLERQIQYLHDDGKEMVTTMPIKSIHFPAISGENNVLVNVLLQSGDGAMNTASSTIYQVLEPGKVSLARKIDITSRDEKKYGEAVITRHFERKETDHVLLANGEAVKLEKNRSFISDLLKDKKTEIDAYISTNNIKCKSLKDFQLIIGYYNSLVK